MNEKILKTVRENASVQATPECRENYLTSCEKHGNDTAEAARIVREEFAKNPLTSDKGSV